MIMPKTLDITRLAGLTLLSGALLLAGCSDDLLLVEDPDTVNPATLDDPLLLSTVVTGAYREFVVAYSGSGGDAYLSVGALMSDEYRSAGTFSTRNATDRRRQQPIDQGNTSDGTYINLHQARFAARDAAERVAQFENTADPRYIQLKSLEAMTMVMLGEGFCSSTPLSFIAEDGSFDFGMPMTSAQVLEEAVATADAAGGGDLAAMVKGRALLSLGRYAEAAAAVSGIPTSFVFYARHSVEGAQNPIFNLQDQRRYAIPDREGGTGLPFRSEGTQYDATGTTVIVPGDLRMPWFEDPRGGFEEGRDAFSSLRYPLRTDPVPVSTGIEARLIEAEAALTSDPARMVEILNELRANAVANMGILATSYTVPDGATLAPLVDPGTADGRRDLLFKERGFWLYLTGHRFSDLRRLVANYGLPQELVYPTGVYYKDDGSGSDVYANDVVFPVDFDEANNPNYDLSSCVVTSASYN